MKVRFTTLGCKLNFAESSALGKELLSRGHERAGKTDVPDVCVVNTCSVTDAADHKDRQTINQLHRKYPDAIIIVTGCYAQLQPKQIAEIHGVDYVLGQNEKYDIPALVDALEKDVDTRLSIRDSIRVCAIREVDAFYGVRSGDDRTRCFIKVQDGCNYFCTYCTIPYARGKSRNPRIEEVIKNAQEAIDEGAKELILTGVNIGDFGRSTSETFIDLLRALDCLEVRGDRQEARGMDYRIRISSCEPNLLTDEIIDFVAQSKHFAPHFHIPLQSGSNEVLKIMGRRYTRELFAERVQHIKQVMPHAFIGVDCMVGVRGETQAYWEDYLEFVKGLDVSQLHVFTYSERANTRMLEMDLYVVPKAERQRRSKILHAVSEEKTRAFYEKHANRKTVVLWESKKEGDQMAGFTDNYIKIYRSYDKAKVNTFEEV
ncbi:MAG: tRNA (N(6)-L-threonylcarbamoyladenosine(37)-C(2))-methylthiotransferase MtaB [Paludibacteraceae bacterium]|jgi:threonylcarbamoyladenosine tRNA methylthiotransferase MtaB|nr:tRNA (N(6)-L-threonylcarbamoyladenosine(37)-C(2))-methylthiotransferase MtaB [Paludibacteraceae bacterium]